MTHFDSSRTTWHGHDIYLVTEVGDSEAEEAGWLIYAPTLKLALLVSRRLGECVRNGQFPVEVERKLAKQIPHAQRPYVPPTKAFHLAIGLTQNCTLHCAYCHADADRHVTIAPELIAIATEHAFVQAGQTPRKILTVSFAVGGEPTMEWELFTETVDAIREKERQNAYGVTKAFLSMTTNGYYGDVKREYVAQNFDDVTLSLDGNPLIQNLHRPTPNGRGSYSVVAETYKYFLRCATVKVGIRATVSAISAPFLKEIVEHFYREFGSGFSVTFEPLVKAGRALVRTDVPPPSNGDFADNFLLAKRRGEELGIRVMTSAANAGRLIARHCGAMAIPSLTLCCDGQLTACHRDQDARDYGYGRIEMSTGRVVLNGDKIRQNLYKAEIPDSCNECFVKWHCAGDCPDLRRIGYSRCDVNRFLVFDEIQKLMREGRESRARNTDYS